MSNKGIVLYCILLYFIVLYCIALHCIVLYYIVLYCAVLCCVVLCCVVLCCTVLYCTELYCIVLYCIVLYCIVLYCIVLYCIVYGLGLRYSQMVLGLFYHSLQKLSWKEQFKGSGCPLSKMQRIRLNSFYNFTLDIVNLILQTFNVVIVPSSGIALYRVCTKYLDRQT